MTEVRASDILYSVVEDLRDDADAVAAVGGTRDHIYPGNPTGPMRDDLVLVIGVTQSGGEHRGRGTTNRYVVQGNALCTQEWLEGADLDGTGTAHRDQRMLELYELLDVFNARAEVAFEMPSVRPQGAAGGTTDPLDVDGGDRHMLAMRHRLSAGHVRK